MEERYNRDPAHDLGRHVITGEMPPLSGDPVIQKYDAELDRNDPMQPTTEGSGDNFYTSPDLGGVMQLNDAQAVGLSSGNVDTRPEEALLSAPVDMNVANDWADEPTKGGLSYGPSNTGGGY